MDNYKELLERSYLNLLSECSEMSRLEFLGDWIFEFTTYDSEMSEMFAVKALEVAIAISTSTTFDYIKDKQNYTWYLLMMNTPFFSSKTEWGSSVRGAWWSHPEVSIECCGLVNDVGEQILDLKLKTGNPETLGEIGEFIQSMANFAYEGEGKVEGEA